MTRSIIIANCLLNSSMVVHLEDGEQLVRNVFDAEFPDERFEDWNREVDKSVADHIIKMVGRASRIDVAKFIDDLRDN